MFHVLYAIVTLDILIVTVVGIMINFLATAIRKQQHQYRFVEYMLPYAIWQLGASSKAIQ